MTSSKAKMMKPWKRILHFLDSTLQFQKTTFSQFGEDLIVSSAIANFLEDEKITYVDIGANHPFILSNTALFYQKGSRGILVEPNADLARSLQKARPRDTVLHCGVGPVAGEKEFYFIDPNVLSTFSKEECERYVSMGHRLKSTAIVEIVHPHTIFQKLPRVDFLNIDVEGMDFEILKAINFQEYRPFCICVETLMYLPSKDIQRIPEITDHLLSNGYMIYADTSLNTIFIDKSKLP